MNKVKTIITSAKKKRDIIWNYLPLQEEETTQVMYMAMSILERLKHTALREKTNRSILECLDLAFLSIKMNSKLSKF